MRIYTALKPRKVMAATKTGIMNKLQLGGYKSNSYGTGYSNRQYGFTMVNFEKIRRKRGVRRGHWVAYAYTFSYDFLKANNLKVKQNLRNFDILSK